MSKSKTGAREGEEPEMKTITQLQHALNTRLAEIAPGFECSHALSSEMGGRRLYGRHTSVYVPATGAIVTRLNQENRDAIKQAIGKFYAPVTRSWVERGSMLFSGNPTVFRKMILLHPECHDCFAPIIGDERVCQRCGHWLDK